MFFCDFLMVGWLRVFPGLPIPDTERGKISFFQMPGNCGWEGKLHRPCPQGDRYSSYSAKSLHSTLHWRDANLFIILLNLQTIPIIYAARVENSIVP